VVVLLAVLNALLGMSLGLFASAFAQTEFQAVQFIPLFVLPQFLLCGLLVARDRMAPLLEWISYALPLTWAVDGMQHAVSGGSAALIARDAAIVLGVTVLALALGAATLRRRTT
jgi:ABC-2 type transport system permease protein